MAQTRADRTGAHRSEFDKNRKKILQTQEICGICGKPVDKSLRWPHPLSATVDHIIPVDRGGHPSAMANLQLAHWTCNRQKSDKIMDSRTERAEEPQPVGNRLLPQSIDWTQYRS
ncbi:MAG: HNH endonuclease signature motif containing protein [Candidatus Onthomonas sp.]